MFSGSVSKKGLVALVVLIITSIITGFFSEFGSDLYHTIKYSTTNLPISITPLAVLLITLLIAVASGSLFIYDIFDNRRKRNNRKAVFREKIRKMEDGEPDTESY